MLAHHEGNEFSLSLYVIPLRKKSIKKADAFVHRAAQLYILKEPLCLPQKVHLLYSDFGTRGIQRQRAAGVSKMSRTMPQRFNYPPPPSYRRKIGSSEGAKSPPDKSSRAHPSKKDSTAERSHLSRSDAPGRWAWTTATDGSKEDSSTRQCLKGQIIIPKQIADKFF